MNTGKFERNIASFMFSSPPILGLQTCLKLNLGRNVDALVTGAKAPITKKRIVQDYPDVFKRLGS